MTEGNMADVAPDGAPASPKSEAPKSAHTPGPWTIVEGHRDRTIYARDSDGDETVVAEVHWWALDGAAESAANAHLIAAAPELLGALKRIINWCPMCHGSGEHAPIVAWPAMPEADERRARAELPASVPCNQCGFAHAAIAKATGR